MKFKGILKGDGSYRHFEFDEDDVIIKNSIPYYKVNYGKNPLEGPDADDEIQYIPCDKVMVLGGKKPKTPIKEEKTVKTTPVKPVKKEVKETKPKKTTKAKKTVEEKSNTYPPQTEVYVSPEKFEYYVEELTVDEVDSLRNKLNELGDDGWELCGFDTNKSFLKSIHILVIFKRKRG